MKGKSKRHRWNKSACTSLITLLFYLQISFSGASTAPSQLILKTGLGAMKGCMIEQYFVPDFRIGDVGQPHSSTLRCLRRQTHIWPARLPFFFFPMLRSYFFSFLQLSGSFSYLLRAPLTTMLQKSTNLKHQLNL